MPVKPPFTPRRLFAALALLAAFLAPVLQVARTVAPAAAVGVALHASSAHATEDATYSAVTSTSGASVAFAVRQTGTTIVLQSQTCSFHYRCCTSSSCTAAQTDLYVSQFMAWPVPLPSDRTYCAVACDGTTTGTVNPYQMVAP